VLENQKQIEDGKENETNKELKIDNTGDKIDNYSSCIGNLSYALPNYKYTKEDIEKFFASDNGQKEKHTLEESICWPLIGKRNNMPYFLYCKICPKVENIHLKSIEHHIKFKDPNIIKQNG
jgi:hypothetical protein